MTKLIMLKILQKCEYYGLLVMKALFFKKITYYTELFVLSIEIVFE